jgi:DNA adenine methylase
MKHSTTTQARPFLKWAGGKSQILDELIARMPSAFNAYHEPFVGSGALFFALASQSALGKTYLSDSSLPLIETYLAVRNEVDDLIRLLARHKSKHSRDYYYKLRARNAEKLSPLQRAARMIYLNKTCYNGLYRENKAGQFNVPLGRYKNPSIYDEDNLRVASEVLRKANVTRRHFATALRRVKPGDFVYFDPPYHPRSRTSSFTAYDGEGFAIKDQVALRLAFGELAERGVHVMLSNSDTPLIRELYAGYRVDKVQAKRAINSKGGARGKITELIIRSY